MGRIHIALPEAFLFETELTIRVTDLNYGNHVGNDNILSLLHEVRVQFYRNLGYKNELNIEGEVGQIVTDAAIVYKSEAFLGDVLIGKIGVADFNKYGFDFIYQLVNKGTAKEVARAKTGTVYFDYAARKIAAIPLSFREKLLI
ncbi:MAG TPA: thioesterase family protein [Chryseosolibacter sp.]|nr:thioesterase family protein [Chryseosolibacter sp.]